MIEAPLISVVVPCYNEAENIPLLAGRIERVLQRMRYELLLVDDGSEDATASVVRRLAGRDERIRYLTLSRNFGHQAALKAGIDHARGDVVVTMDADLQHPPEKIPEMLALWGQGYEVVTARREDDKRRGLIKRLTATLYYGLLNWLTAERIPGGVADFRLFDRRVAGVIRRMPEGDLYLRGLFAWVGFRQTTVSYREEARHSGGTKYGAGKMMRLAASGITSFSVRPLRLSLAVGVFVALLAFVYGVYAVVMLVRGETVTGWTSVIASILFLSGIQLIVLGILGEYLGKLFLEQKRRPVYIVSESNIRDQETMKNRKNIKKRSTTETKTIKAMK